MRQGFMKMPAMAVFLISGSLAAPVAAENIYPECHLHRSAEVSFRAPDSKDVMEVSIGTGLCYRATLTLVIRDQYGDVLYKRTVEGMDDIPPAIFPHWVHRMQYKCSACHDELFKMQAGANEVTMDLIAEGKSCGVCHDGKKAFISNVDTCLRCHYK